VLYAPDNVGQKVQLSQSERVQIADIRTQWCRTMPTFRPVQPNEMYYDLGVQCEYDSRRIKIPLDQLPEALGTLLKRIPKLKP